LPESTRDADKAFRGIRARQQAARHFWHSVAGLLMARLEIENKIICKTRMIIHLKVLFVRMKENLS
jgi:hypothetical protein